MKLRVDEDQLASCVSCGLCLPHCPTFRVTGEERYSPRGRIEAMRQVHLLGREADESFLDIVDTCVQCRGCETACPSAVPFGRLMEATRDTLAREAGYQPWWRRLAFRTLGHHRLLLAGSRALAGAQRARLIPRKLADRLGLPGRLPLHQPKLTPSGRGDRPDDIWLLTGCVMDAWQRDVHRDVQLVAETVGAKVALPGPGAGCCGALHAHAGLLDQARALARRTMAALPGNAPIVVDSAGCGAQMKDYGHLLGTDEAHDFSRRVVDVHEWLLDRLDQLPLVPTGPDRPSVAVQDPCHLRHVQRAHLPVRAVLSRVADVVELDDEGLCCGAGGAYSVLQPDLARAIRARKLEALDRAGAGAVASANPGCSMHLAGAGVDARHPLCFVADALRTGAGRRTVVSAESAHYG